jgi:hypothetical protein
MAKTTNLIENDKDVDLDCLVENPGLSESYCFPLVQLFFSKKTVLSSPNVGFHVIHGKTKK